MGNYNSTSPTTLPTTKVNAQSEIDAKNTQFSRNKCQKVQIKLYAYLIPTTEFDEAHTKIAKSSITNQSTNTISTSFSPNLDKKQKQTYIFTSPTRNSYYRLGFKVDTDSLNTILPEQDCIVDEIVLDYTENDTEFDIEIHVTNFVFQYDVAKFVSKVLATTNSDNIALGKILKEKTYRKDQPFKIEIPKHFRGNAKRQILYSFSEDSHIKRESIALLQQKFTIADFFTVPQKYANDVILDNQHIITRSLLKWGVLEIPNINSTDTHTNLLTPKLVSEWSECIIPSSVIKTVIFKQPESPLINVPEDVVGATTDDLLEPNVKSNDTSTKYFGFKVPNNVYVKSIINLCQNTSLSKTYITKTFNDSSFSIVLAPEQEEMILRRLAIIRDFNTNMDGVLTEICSFMLDIKTIY